MSTLLPVGPDPLALEATLGGDRLTLRHAPLRKLLSRIRSGGLDLTLPDGTRVSATGTLHGPRAELRLHNWRPALRLLLSGDLGFAFAYRDGDWDSPDVTTLLSFALANEAALARTTAPSAPARWLTRAFHRRHANTRRGSRHNIAFHYDLGNDFYRAWLDPGMLYSSALYRHADDPAETLESAQAHRLDRIVSLLDVQPGHQVLEVGCGWGLLAATLARQAARVVGLTLSTEQLAFARDVAASAGVAHRTDLRLQDYRDVDGTYDRIVSIEMVEAVGEAWWPTYFQMLHDRLKPGGVAVVQAITIGEAHFDAYRATPDFIQRCIFPGGMLPTVTAMASHARRAGLSFETDVRFGRSYARTLAEWRERFLAQWPRIAPLGFDERFRRLWAYYLSYCEAGFLAGRVDVGLYRLRRQA